MEEYAYILDYLPPNNLGKKDPVCFALGESEFKLFELVPKKGAMMNIGDRVYIGKENPQEGKVRKEIDHVKRRVSAEDLSNFASEELDQTVLTIVNSREQRFVEFYNIAQSISIKKHLLEELPGLGKKGVEAILEERKKGNFESFADLDKRVPSIKGAAKLIAERVVLEIRDSERRRYLFVVK